ncbi:MAG: hypothetical protein K9N23_18180 [Akkermansiaceae bacterium]|nr:hypothetical protein [Akkermansiaceae bacterium]MCF7733623.1 hypothetical protein [Akkermansiaceae bacterium]
MPACRYRSRIDIGERSPRALRTPRRPRPAMAASFKWCADPTTGHEAGSDAVTVERP